MPVNQMNKCTILPHHADNVGDHLPLKVNITLSCKPSCNSSCDVTLCKLIKSIDWSKERNREQYLENIKRYTVDMNSLNVGNITDSKSAQQCVNELNNGIITTFVRHVLIPQGNATLNHKYKHENQDQHHGGLTLHRLIRTGSHYGMVSGLRVINHAMAMCMYVTNLLKLNTDKFVALP